jgi:hypothetical protein
VSNFKDIKNPARWLHNFIRSIPRSGEAYCAAMQTKANGVENAGIRSIVAVRRAASEIRRIIQKAYENQPNRMAQHLGWEASIDQALKHAIQNQPASNVQDVANGALPSLQFCVATIDDLWPGQDSTHDDPAAVLKELRDFKQTLNSMGSHEARDLLVSAVEALIESLELLALVGFEGVLEAVTRSCIEFLMHAKAFDSVEAVNQREKVKGFFNRTLESVLANGVYEIGKTALTNGFKLLIGS